MEPLSLMSQISDLLALHLPNLIAGLLIIFLGRWIVIWLTGLLRNLFNKTKIDPTLSNFIVNLFQMTLFVVVALMALERVGVKTTSFVALLGAAGLAVGLALEGALGNFAAGALILLFRPFKVGDFVEVAGKFGKVKEIQIFSTILLTLDHKTVIIPNSQTTNGVIVNYSTLGYVRLDLIFGIGYTADITLAKKILLEILQNEQLVLPNPEPVVAVFELADSSVNLAVRPFVKPEHYSAARLVITEQVKRRFDEAKIEIPFPQRDVHLYQTNQ